MSRYFKGLLVLCSILVVSSSAPAQTDTLSGKEAKLKIAVRVYNFPRVAKNSLARAEREATYILRNAGIDLSWIPCHLIAEEVPPAPACELPLGPTDLVLRILPQEMAKRLRANPDELGFALYPTQDDPNRFGNIIYILFHRVRAMANQWDATRAQILAYGIAHEIGHLLLGNGSHSSDGIMNARWGPKSLRLAARGKLLFSPQQAERIRANVLERIREREIAQSVKVDSPQ